MRIRTRLAVVLSTVTAGSFIVAAIVSALIFRSLAFNIFAYHQVRQTQLLAAFAGPLMGTPNQAIVQRYMDSMRQLPGVEYVYLTGPDGRILLHTERSYAGRLLSEWRASPQATAAVELTADLPGAPGTTARVGFALGLFPILLGEIIGAVLVPFILLGVVGVLVSVGLGSWIAAYLARPAQRLVEAARRVGAGDLSARVEGRYTGELGELTSQFNAMVERLRDLDAMKDRLIASVSHDLRNPIAAIKMNIEYMLDDDPDAGKILPRHRTALQRVMSAATRLGVFASNILDSAKMKEGRLEYRLEPVDLEDMAREVCELYSGTAKHREIALAGSLPPGLPRVMADRERLANVLSNLISNALKFTPKGGTVAISAASAGSAVELSISDTGRGIAPEALPRLFQRFEQAGAAAYAGAPGTGLGLYIVKQTIEAMGGAVALASELDKGTRVTVRLPAAGSSAPPIAAPPASAPFGAARVLLIDDDEGFAEALKLSLEAKGYQASVIAEGGRAVDAAVAERPDVIVMDLELGDMPGARAIERLKAEATTRPIPVILCSASRDLARVDAALRAGAALFLVKPVKAAELDRRIRELLAQREAA